MSIREDRRTFLYGLAAATAALPVLPLGLACASAPPQQPIAEWAGAAEGPANPSWSIRLAPDGEPGEPMHISGTVYGPDGRTPAKGILVYAYHTDVTGLYTPAADATGNGRRHGHIRGWMRTGADGRYEFRSIRPASYPNSTIPQHVHMTVSGADYPEYWLDSIWFEGDPFITDRERRSLTGRGGFQPIIRLERTAGGWRGTRDIRIERI